ncbi:MAG: hypothetical protein ACI8ZM_003659 [Crocinitomix sp.]|jgi:hypothetical protein
MKSIIAIFLITIISLIQIASGSFSFYTNQCQSSGNSSISLEKKKCCCDLLKEQNTEKKSCCSKKKKCCPSKLTCEDVISKDCCSSFHHFFQVDNEYSNESEIGQNVVLFVAMNIVIENKTQPICQPKKDFYQCNSPPRTGRELRIFIQSFQI